MLIKSANPIQIRKPITDQRHYEYRELGNGLKTILISDPSAEESAAAIAVEAGSFAEPNEFPGLAHYLEHILFLGTKKYPIIDDFFQFIEKHGGSPNAYTADLRTVYYFDILPEYLEEGMDRLADFFIEPLFDPNYCISSNFVPYHNFFRGGIPRRCSKAGVSLFLKSRLLING